MIDNLIEIVRKAGEIILKIYNSDRFEVELKEDNSPLTKADKASNKFITDSLLASSDFPIISEESIPPHSERINYKKYWLLDPLDGTKDFIAKNDEFTINLALMEFNKPVIGIVYAPALDELAFAIKGKGACLFKNGTKIKLPIKYNNNLVLAKSRFHDTEDVLKFSELNKISESRKIGSALKFIKLAIGEVTIYPRYNGSSEWDIAAGHILVKEANGNLFDIVTKKEPEYGKESLSNNFFIAYNSSVDINKIIMDL